MPAPEATQPAVDTPRAFYITGGTLPIDAVSYVERQADTDLYESLLRGDYCYVLNTRQMGKSSLMVRTARRLRATGCAVAVLDLTAIGQNLDTEQWYVGLLLTLGEQLRLDAQLLDYWVEHSHLGPLQRFIGAIGEIVNRSRSDPSEPSQFTSLVIFVDEIDAVRSLPFADDEFFVGIRECYNRRTLDPAFAQLTFCLLGVAAPADLIRDTRLSPFNIGRRIEVTDFTPEEAAALAAGLHTKDEGGRMKDERKGIAHPSSFILHPSSLLLLNRVLYWTGGHPYLPQRLCRAVSEQGVSLKPERYRPEAVVDRICEALFLTKAARESDNNLAFVRNRLLRSEADIAALLDIYTKVRKRRHVRDDETNPLCSILRLSGVVRSVNGVLRARNRIYDRVFDRDWVVAHMPDAELRRQRAAFRRGALRTAAAAGLSLLLMGALVLVAWRNTRRAEAAVEYANRLLYAANINLAQQKYEAGNMPAALSLLQDTLPKPGEPDRRGFEWYYLNRLFHQERITIQGSVRLWNVDTKQERYAFRGHIGHVYTVAFSADGKTLASGDDKGQIKLWNAQEEPDCRHLYGHSVPLYGLAFSPDGRRLYMGDTDGRLNVWDSGSGDRLAPSVDTGVGIDDIRLSPDGTQIVMLHGQVNCNMSVFDTGTLRRLRNSALTDGYAPQDAIHSDGLLIGRNRELKVLHPFDGRLEKAIDVGQRTLPILSSDGRRIAMATTRVNKSGVITLWDARSGQRLRTWKAHTAPVRALCFSPDGRRLFSNDTNGQTRVWDEDGGQRSEFMTEALDPSFLAIFPDSRRLVKRNEDNSLGVLDLETGRELLTLKGGGAEIRKFVLSPDGKRIAAGCHNGSVILWSAK